MTMVDVQVVIDCPIIEVYDFVTDLRNEPKWWAGVSRSDRLSGEGGVGTRYRLEAKLFGIAVPTDIEVIEAERPNRMAIVAGGRLPYVCRYVFRTEPGGTSLRITVSLKRRIWRLASPLLALVIRYYLRRLNRILTD